MEGAKKGNEEEREWKMIHLGFRELGWEGGKLRCWGRKNMEVSKSSVHTISKE